MADIGSLDDIFVIYVFDYDRDGTHDLMGYVPLSLRALSFGPFDFKLEGAKTGYGPSNDRDRLSSSDTHVCRALSLKNLVYHDAARLPPNPWLPIPPALRMKLRGKFHMHMPILYSHSRALIVFICRPEIGEDGRSWEEV